jgi:4-hydroxy-3-methylbut-2-en-1-yl diphosphate synthase IspG/GcpE
VLFTESGFLSPDVDDALRIAIVVLSVVNVGVLLVTVRTLRQCTRILLDVEQFAREVRQRTRRAEEPLRTDI